jgi:hypothetical protein
MLPRFPPGKSGVSQEGRELFRPLAMEKLGEIIAFFTGL